MLVYQGEPCGVASHGDEVTRGHLERANQRFTAGGVDHDKPAREIEMLLCETGRWVSKCPCRGDHGQGAWMLASNWLICGPSIMLGKHVDHLRMLTGEAKESLAPCLNGRMATCLDVYHETEGLPPLRLFRVPDQLGAEGSVARATVQRSGREREKHLRACESANSPLHSFSDSSREEGGRQKFTQTAQQLFPVMGGFWSK